MVRFSIGVLAMATSVHLVSQQRLGVDDPLTSCIVLHGGVALDPVVPDFSKRQGVPILPGWRPHHASVPEDVGDTSEEEDRQHLSRYHLGRDSLMGVICSLVPALYISAFRWKNKWTLL